jgi:hypothetical protein
MRDVSSRAFEMSLLGGSVRRVSREVRLVMVDECGGPLRLMTMGRMSTAVRSQCWRMALARGCICRGSFELCGRDCGRCSTSIPHGCIICNKICEFLVR